MSAWTDEEVDQMEQRGGNNVARRTWLKHAPPTGQGGRPQPGSDLAVFKAFVVDVYEKRIYYGNDEEESIPGTPAPLFASTTAVKIKPTKTVIATVPMSAPLPPVMDLLDIFSEPEPIPSTQVDLFKPTLPDFSTVLSAPLTASFSCVDTMTSTAPVHTFAADFHGLTISTTPAMKTIPTITTPTTQKPIMGGMSATNSFAISNWMGTVPPLSATCHNNINNIAAGTNMMMNDGMQQHNIMMNNGMQQHNMMMNNGIQQHNVMMNNGMQQHNVMMNNGSSGMNHMQQHNLLMMQQQLMLQMNNGSMNPLQQQQMMTMMQQQITAGEKNLQMNKNDGIQMNHQGGTMSMSKSTNNGSQFPSHWP